MLAEFTLHTVTTYNRLTTTIMDHEPLPSERGISSLCVCFCEHFCKSAACARASLGRFVNDKAKNRNKEWHFYRI